MSGRVCGGRLSRRTLIFIVVGVVAILALAIGLGVGLGVGGGGDDDDSEPTTPTTPRPPRPTNGTFWQPAVNSSWQIVLINPIDVDSDATSVTPNVDIWDIDLYTNANSTFTTLHRLGKRIICYFSAGSYEPNRPDSTQFKDSDMGKGLDGWPGEKWLNLSSANVRNIMANRIALASSKGCDAIDPDNVDGYDNDNGLDLTAEDSIDFMTYLADEAARYNMSIGLKNAGKILPNLTDIVHFSVNEQCIQYGECESFAPMIQAGKPVFNIEYPSGSPGNVRASAVSTICSTSGNAADSEYFSKVIKAMNLDGWVEYCDGTTANTTLTQSST